ncbi:MAG: heavy metal-responsive transcriptional regulator [Actinomycetes bacterium]
MLIGEVADATGVTTKTLRYYEGQGLLHEPARTAGGYRDYRPEVVDRVGFIRQAQAAGLTLAQIGEILEIRDGGRAPCGHVATLVDTRLAEVEQRLAELEHTRTQLRELRDRLDELDPDSCPPNEICVAVSGL